MSQKIFFRLPALIIGALAVLFAQGAMAATVVPPVFTPAAGSYNNSVDVSMTCATPGATIYYTTDGTDPTEADGIEYDPEFPETLEEDTVIKAFAVKTGSTDSAISVGSYTIVNTTPKVVVATPVFSPTPAVSYPNNVTVTMSCATPEATIYYTTDGTDPTLENAEIYDPESPPVFDDATTTVKAFATGDSNDTDSSVATATYTVILPPPIEVAKPVFTPAAGTYNDIVKVKLSTTTPNATIYYTTDGTAPDPATSDVFDEFTPIELTADTTVKAVAVRKNDTNSAVASAFYHVIDTPAIIVAAPVFKPGPGTYYDYVEVAMTTTTPGATIYYTVDGTEPTLDPNSDFVYDPEFPEFVVDSEVIKAVAVRTGDTRSTTTTGTFTILPLPAPKLTVKAKTKFTVTKPTLTIKGTSTFANEIDYTVGKSKKVKVAKGTPAKWKIKLKLKPGLNLVAISAIGTYEDSKPKKLKITYAPAVK